MHMFICVSVFAAGIAVAAVADAATITVGPTGDLQAALNTAQPGDVILLTPGAVYSGNFVLPVKSNPNGIPITIRSAADPSTLPGPGQRIMPANASRLGNLRIDSTR